MLKELIRNEISLIIGRGYSCCKRNLYIIGYKGIWIGDTGSKNICLSFCNTQLANLMDSYYQEYPEIQPKINVESLRGTTH